MLALLSLYSWTIFAGIFAAPSLALLGSQLATRDRAMQTMCIGQGAMVGVLCGIGVVHTYEWEWLETFGPFVSALVFSALTVLLTDSLVAKRTASKNTTFAFIFALLLASSFLVSSLFPALENHMAQIYFGDLATLTISHSKITLVASIVALFILVGYWKNISNQSFELAMFGDFVSSRSQKRGQLVFKITSLLLLCLSIQFVGFLFTIAMLFVPTALMNFLQTNGIRLHFALTAVVSVIGTLVGFVFSLVYTRVPTVPAIVAVMFLASMVIVGFERAWLWFSPLYGAVEKRIPVTTEQPSH